MTKYAQFYKELLLATMKNSTCARLNVAAIIVKDGRIINSGWNGSMPKQEHCIDVFANWDKTSPEFYVAHGEWSRRHESHAEISAIATAAKLGIAVDGWDMAVTYSPCGPCAKTIVMAGIKKVYYLTKYDRDPEGIEILLDNGLQCIQLP